MPVHAAAPGPTVTAPLRNGEPWLDTRGQRIQAHGGGLLQIDGWWYWYLDSGCTGWDPNPARSAVTDDPWGEWHELGNPCSGPVAERSFTGQSTFLQSLPDGRLLAVFDRWDPQDLADSRYLWLEASIDGGELSVPWRAAWRGLRTG